MRSTITLFATFTAVAVICVTATAADKKDKTVALFEEVELRTDLIGEFADKADKKDKKDKPVALFDGKDLSAWTYHLRDSKAKMDDVWSIKDGVLVCTGKPAGYLRTKDDFANYVLTVEWRWPKGSKGGNSGVLVHTVGEDMVWPKSIESQLMHGNAGDFWVIGGTEIDVPNADARRKGRRTVNLTDDSEKPIGQWNTMEITCKWGEVIVKINGDLVNHGRNATVQKGAICLQSEGAEVHFRNVKLMRLGE